MLATCLGCGLACDDIEIAVEGGRIVEAGRACDLGARWFGDGSTPSRVRMGDADTTLDEALDAVAALITSAAAPLVYIAPELSIEAQREGIAIADLLRARLDSVTSAGPARSILAAEERGRASATLGEIRNRADVIVFWGVDPGDAYPRFWTRVAPEPVGIHVPGGRRGRTVIAVDVGDARGPADADRRIAIAPLEEASTLSSAAAGEGPLAALLGAGRYVAIVADAEAETAHPGRADGLIALAQALNASTRCALTLLRGGGNRSGADACLTWQTGYPMAVDFAHGAPRYRPHDGDAATALGRGLVDAALVLGAVDLASPAVVAGLGAVRSAVIGPRASESAPAAGAPAVAIDTATAGIHEAGTAVRLDDVPLPLRAVVSGPPAARDVLRALTTRIAASVRA